MDRSGSRYRCAVYPSTQKGLLRLETRTNREDNIMANIYRDRPVTMSMSYIEWAISLNETKCSNSDEPSKPFCYEKANPGAKRS
jgi:hypothetical protein